jgi:tripartite-type tricarboxylate transporter receptor subunit TctC
MKKFVWLAFAAIAVLLQAPLSHAQSWPQRPVKLVVALGPGSGADLSARLIADRLTKRWGQAVVVENRPGGDGVVAINAVLSARDDHTLLYAPTSTFVGHPYTLEKLPYDPKQLVPVARVTNTVVVVAVPASLPAKSMQELIAAVRAQPGKMNWSSAVGMTDIIFAGYFKNSGLDMAQVRYRDTVSAMNDLVEGRIQLYAGAYVIARAHVQAGKVRVLAVTNRSRAPGLPDVPTVAEAGFPDLNFDGLVGAFVARSAGMPDAVRERIAADIKAAVTEPEVSARLAATVQIVNPGSPAEFAAAIDEQAGQLATFAKALGIEAKR